MNISVKSLWSVFSSTAILTALVLALAQPAHPQNYAINWFTIDGGGSTSTGSVFSVSGTIGQPDAGALSGGPYSLVGGFWGIAAIQTPGAPRLSVERNNGMVRVYWPLPATGFVLDDTTALAAPPAAISWTQVVSGYQTNATHIFITVPAPMGNKFYRLRKP